MAWPRFALISERHFRKLTSAEQYDIADEAARAFPELGRDLGKNPSYRWVYVKKAAALYRDQAGNPPRAPAPGILPAREVNEWLRSLPPVPYFNETSA